MNSATGLYEKLKKTIAVLCACLVLSGCASSVPIKQNTALTTLPPIQQPYEAPLGDAGESMVQTMQLSLPSIHGGQLIMVQERILTSHIKHPAEYALRRLFTFPGTTQAAPLVQGEALSLNPGSSVEISGGTATVNLAPSALALSNKERYLAFRAITNTLAQWGDIRFVNILVNGRQQGIDTAGKLPLGSLSRTENEDINALWEAVNRQPAGMGSPFSSVATLYFPALAGMGILAEARTVNFQEHSLPSMARSLLTALSAGSATHPELPQLPNLDTLLLQDPEIIEQPGSTGRIIRLRFHESTNESLIQARIPRSILMASLTYTLTTFLPYISGIKVHIGQEAINALVPAGVYEGANETILFDDGLMQRSQFSRFLLDFCTLYFADNAGKLSKTMRAIPSYQVYNPRYLINQLMQGPKNTDASSGLHQVLPDNVSDKDLLGITRVGDSMVINLSAGFLSSASQSNPEAERLMVYSMVNTLTAQHGINRVVFFINGQQDGTFCGTIDIAGEFLRNEGILR